MLQSMKLPVQRGGGEKASRAMRDGAEARENGAEGMRLVRPRALLLTAAVPEKDGSPARRCAWRLLDLARQTHEVHLLVRIDGGVQYDHWRRLTRMTRQMTLVPHGLLFHGTHAVADTVTAWAARQSFDAVLCSDSRLWNLLDGVAGRVRFCVGRHDVGILQEVLTPPAEVSRPIVLAPPLRRAA